MKFCDYYQVFSCFLTLPKYTARILVGIWYAIFIFASHHNEIILEMHMKRTLWNGSLSDSVNLWELVDIGRLLFRTCAFLTGGRERLVSLNRLAVGFVTTPRRQSSDSAGFWILSSWSKQCCHLTDMLIQSISFPGRVEGLNVAATSRSLANRG